MANIPVTLDRNKTVTIKYVATRPTIDSIAQLITAYEILQGSRINLTRAEVYTYSGGAIQAAKLYAFKTDGNPEAFLAIEQYATYFGIELARMTGAEVHVVVEGTDYNLLTSGERGHWPTTVAPAPIDTTLAGCSARNSTLGINLTKTYLSTYTQASRGILEAKVYLLTRPDGNPEAILSIERYGTVNSIEWQRLSGDVILVNTPQYVNINLNTDPSSELGYVGLAKQG
jgi:hypothetical protein